MLKRILYIYVAIFMTNMAYALPAFNKSELKSVAKNIKALFVAEVPLEGSNKSRIKSFTRLERQLNNLLENYMVFHDTKENGGNANVIMTSQEVGMFVNAYNQLITEKMHNKDYLFSLEQADFDTMHNENLLGALFFVPDITVSEYVTVLSGRIALALAAKNVDSNQEAVCATTSTDDLFDMLTITKSDMSSNGFAEKQDINNKDTVDKACKK